MDRGAAVREMELSAGEFVESTPSGAASGALRVQRQGNAVGHVGQAIRREGADGRAGDSGTAQAFGHQHVGRGVAAIKGEAFLPKRQCRFMVIPLHEQLGAQETRAGGSSQCPSPKMLNPLSLL